ncbi:hypothetical protein SLEP1_g45125 [Rubroshorea leprosula]|uniref:Uncharacterized protein n=1 Tax=Rubroshorea leprosula TaxID=152421 RepID=A0AAV5LI57_9ROSI|nr:hypothetical protein SLEP1_g45125 [Rubroshorea leprosula]
MKLSKWEPTKEPRSGVGEGERKGKDLEVEDNDLGTQ